LAPFAKVAGPLVGFVEAPDGVLERLPLDEAHGVAGQAVLVPDQAVDRHDAGVLELAGQFGLA
jgi:hypothetical protein